MTSSRRALVLAVALFSAGLAGCAAAVSTSTAPPAAIEASSSTLESDLDRIFDDPALEGALLAVHIESIADGRVLYEKNADARVVPASSLKIITAAAAADRLGWQHRFETRLEATGPVIDGVLEGDLIVVGSGDPTINAQDLIDAPLFEQWARTLRAAGIRHVAGRLIGDDNAFDDEPLGAGWAWDYLTATYAAPSGALSYNENLVAVRAIPGPAAGTAARVNIEPPGHDLAIVSQVTTVPPDAPATLILDRLPGRNDITIRGQVPAGASDTLRATTVVNPTLFFVGALRIALARHGIDVRGGAVDIDELPPGASLPEARRLLAAHQSAPLSVIVAEMLKRSQNYYGEMLIKAIGRTMPGADGHGSTERGRQAVRQTLERWGIDTGTLVMHDGSGLSRYNYASAGLLVDVLRRLWNDEVHRAPFVASLPVAGHDGTLSTRMTGILRRRVQAKTGTISNVRALAGYAEPYRGGKIVFAMVANHFVAPSADVDAVMERALERVIEATANTTGGR